MSNDAMIAAILAAIQTDANLLILLRALVNHNVPLVSTAQLQGMCNALGISTT